MAKRYVPLAGETGQEKRQAALTDDFTFSAACAANDFQTWDQFLAENHRFKGLLDDAEHKGKYELLLSRAFDNLHRATGEKIDPDAEVRAVRRERLQVYEERNKEQRYSQMKDTFLQAAYRGESWETVENELQDLTPWDHELFGRACAESGISEPIAPDRNAEAFKSGFLMG